MTNQPERGVGELVEVVQRALRVNISRSEAQEVAAALADLRARAERGERIEANLDEWLLRQGYADSDIEWLLTRFAQPILAPPAQRGGESG